MSTTRIIHRTLAPVGLGLLLFGCASTRPSPMLVEARESYDEARTGPANRYAPDLVYEARTSLEDAERAHARDPGSSDEEHKAYLAHRRSLLAMAAADERVAHEDTSEARRQFQTVLVSQRDQAMGRLESSQSELGQERAARKKAEEEARRAMASLQEIASVKAEEQRTTITLSGEVLFKTNEATLLPIAQSRLQLVADALKTQDEAARIVIEGHTDSRGSDSFNRDLSQRRAEAVRSFLVSRGLQADRVQAIGKGEAEPVAENKTAEGRANNRRVEIVIDRGLGGMGGGQGSTGEGSPGGTAPAPQGSTTTPKR